jgi:hypothetical protein
MSVKLGEFRQKRWERISFRDWCLKGYARSGRYSVRVIFPPGRFPSFTFVFEDSANDLEVRLSLRAEKVKEAFRALGIELKKTNLPALVVEVQADENGIIYGLDIDKETPTQLVWKGSYWARWNSLNDPWEDLKDSF